MSKPIYKAGRQIVSISDFDTCESPWYKWHGKTVHRAMLMSLQYRILLRDIKAGYIYAAEKREDKK